MKLTGSIHEEFSWSTTTVVCIHHLGCSCASKAELCICDRDWLALNTENIYYLPLHKKSLPSPVSPPSTLQMPSPNLAQTAPPCQAGGR